MFLLSRVIFLIGFLSFALTGILAQDLYNGLVGYYSFCGCNANDHSGQGNDGTLVGAPDCIPGIKGEGFYFNRQDLPNDCGQTGGEYVQLPTIGPIWEDGFSVCAWVQYENVANFERIIDFGNDSGDNGGLNVWFGREGNSNNLTLESWVDSDSDRNRGTGRLVATDAITNGQIEFYCATINGNTMRIFVNGQLVAEKQGNPIANVERRNNFIGRSNWCFADPDFQGFMDEVRIYNRALSSEEIARLFNAPFLISEPEITICQGESVSLAAQGGVRYEWAPAEFLDDPFSATPTARPDANTTFTVNVFFPDNCSILDTVNITVIDPSISQISATICEGEVFEGYSAMGTYVDTLTGVNGCDSIRTLELNVVMALENTIMASVCSGEIFEGYSNSGIYRDTFQSATGCDSIRILMLNVIEPITNIENKTICLGETFQGFSSSGIYTDTLISSNGCDSINILNLFVQAPMFSFIGTLNATCGNEDGAIDFIVDNTSGFEVVTLNDSLVGTANQFQNLAAGSYVLSIEDGLGCRIEEIVEIFQRPCQVFIPNIFSPNGDGFNDQFQIFQQGQANPTLNKYQIFSRWGELLYEVVNTPFESMEGRWWDGIYQGEFVESGLYIYHVEIDFGNGQIDNSVGEINVIR